MKLTAAELWPAGLLALLVLGMAPGFLLRQIVRIYPKHDPRRRELVAELYAVEHHRQLLFVTQHLELAISEGVPARWRLARERSRRSPSGSRVVEDGFLGPQVCRIVGLTDRQLEYWARTGLIRPSIEGPDVGQRRYSYRDLVELKVVRGLLDAGVALQSARGAIEFLRDNLSERVATASLVTDGTHSTLVQSDRELVELVRRSRGVMSVVAPGGVEEALDAAITDRVVTGSGPRKGGRDPGTRRAARRRRWASRLVSCVRSTGRGGGRGRR